MIEITPQYLFNVLHGLQGKSAEAARLAYDKVRYIDPAVVFSGEKSTLADVDQIGQYAGIAAVTALAAVKRGDSDWAEMLGIALTVQTKLYPYAVGEDEAVRRGDAWMGVYGNKEPTPICLRDTLHLIQSLQLLSDDERLDHLKAGIVEVISNMSGEEVVGHIGVVEMGEYSQAVEAFRRFTDYYGREETPDNPNEIITVSARMMGRSVDELSIGTWFSALSVLTQTVFFHPGRWKFAGSEIVKNFSARWKAKVLMSRMQHIRESNEFVNFPKQTLEEFLVIGFVGLGHEQATSLSC